MSRRLEPNRKKPLEVLDDLLAGHREAAYGGPVQAAKYLERALDGNKSMPNACKFFVYDLLAEAAAAAGNGTRSREAVLAAQVHLSDAQADAPRHLQDYLPDVRFFERGIAHAVEDAEPEKGLQLCDEAEALGLGKHYAAKAHSIRRMM